MDKQLGISDMLSIFLVPSKDALLMLNAGVRGGHFPAAIVPQANDFFAVAKALLTARGSFTDKPAGPSLAKLTAREIEILNWVGEGKQNIEIASILGRSPHTIRKHIENIFTKLGVETRTAAATALRDSAVNRTARPARGA